MQSILHAMVELGGAPAIDFDFVLVVGHFLTRDENIFTFFEVRHWQNLANGGLARHLTCAACMSWGSRWRMTVKP